MFPGVSIPPEGLPSFLEGQPWAVKVPGNPAPIAVSHSNYRVFFGALFPFFRRRKALGRPGLSVFEAKRATLDSSTSSPDVVTWA